MKQLFFTLFVLVSICQFPYAQNVPNQSTLTIEQIMQGNKFVGYLPSRISWSEDNQHIYFNWNPEMDTLTSTYKVSISGGTPEKVDAEALKLLPFGGTYNQDYSLKAYTKNGDLFLHDLRSGAIKQITNTLDYESSPKFANNGKHLVFSSKNNLFSWSLENGTIRQLTNFKKEASKKEKKKSDWQKWLEADQLAYFEILNQRKETREARERRNKSNGT